VQPTRFFGWKVAWAAFLVAVFGWGIGFYGAPIYLHAVHETRGWSVGLVSAAVTLHFLFGAFVVANLPGLHRRFGLPAVTKAGSLALGLGIFGWALAAEPYQLFAATLLSGAGSASLGAAAINAIVSPWFARRRPAALALAYNGASVGGIVFSPLWVALIAALGFRTPRSSSPSPWRRRYGSCATGISPGSPPRWACCPTATPPTRLPRPAAASGASPLPGSALWRNRHFVTLAAGMALGLFAQIGMIAHLFSLLVPALGAQAAGLAMALATACAIAGRTLVGWFMPPRADRRLVAAANYALQIVACLAFMAAGGQHVLLLLLGVVLFGVGIGNATSLPPLIAQAEFAKDDVPRAVALITATAQASYAFAPTAFGLIREWAPAGDARPFFIAAVLFQAAAIAAYILGRRSVGERAALPN
jgi:MFS family permease